MYKFTVTWYVGGVKIETEVFFDNATIADMGLDKLSPTLIEFIGNTKPVVSGPPPPTPMLS